METVRLSPRLQKIADLVPAGAKLADVGTDHGFLPVWLLLHERIASAVATDIRPGPLSKAIACSEACQVNNMRCLLCDGLDGVSAEDVNTVVIAGMGGENIADILCRAPWVRQNTTLILQPMSRAEILRDALSSLGLCTLGEYLVKDSGRIYSVLLTRGGEPYPYSAAELYTGRSDQVRGEELFPEFIKELHRKFSREAEGLSHSAKPEDISRLQKNRIILEQLKLMEESTYAESI